MTDKKNLTTSTGTPITNDQNSQTTGKKVGYTLIQDSQLTQKLAHFNRERIPERVVHAKGTGAHGYFELTKDLSEYTIANFLNGVGKKTELFARFSTVGGEQGSSDNLRDPRGFALKFYTEEGNYDMVGNNIPIFFIRDAIKFPDFIHTQKRDPQTGLKDPNMVWDFFSLTPESLHQATFLFTDRGTPKGFRHMHGFSSHTYMFYNKDGKITWFKWHFKTDQGIENFTAKEAEKMDGANPDYAREDLFNSIEEENYPSWTVYLQLMTDDERKKYEFDPFDVTKVWYHKDAPLTEVGKMVLNKNPENFFEEVEQAAFAPSNLVPGIYPSPDKLLQGRMFAYEDAHRYRLGVNHTQLKINASKSPHYSNQRDGYMTNNNYSSEKNYYPNSINNIGESDSIPVAEIELEEATLDKHRIEITEEDFTQVGEFWRRVLDEKGRESLVANISNHLSGALERIQYRQTALFYLADPDYGKSVANSLNLDIEKVKKLANMNQGDRVEATKENNWK